MSVILADRILTVDDEYVSFKPQFEFFLTLDEWKAFSSDNWTREIIAGQNRR